MNDIRAQTIADSPPTGGRLLSSLLETASAIEARIEDVLGAVDLSRAKYHFLSEVVEAGESLSLGAVAERICCGRSNVTQLVDRLEAAGFVRRVPDPDDRRCVRVEITPTGRERQRQGARRMAAVVDEVASVLSGEDRAVLHRLLERFHGVYGAIFFAGLFIYVIFRYG